MKSILCLLLAVPTCAFAGSAEKLSAGNLTALHELIQPKADELVWKESIPWRTDLWEARREAAAAGKPIFLWEMDGHPLGCT